VYKEYHTDAWGWLPLGWLGRFLARREAMYHDELAAVAGVPALLARLGDAALLREFIPGNDLAHVRDRQGVDEAFFPRLRQILAAIHERGVAHNDLSKPENVLVRHDGWPVVIDFQIAVMPKHWFAPLRWVSGPLLRYLQRVDVYHVWKNHRRVRPQDLSPEELAKGRHKGWLLFFHYYLLRNPYRLVRHRWLRRYKLPEETEQQRRVA
jgi:RIO-like serine/threonine protein kinase